MTARFLVSGGSGGIGAAICTQLSKAGYTPLVGYGRSREKAEAIAEACGGEAVALDLSDTHSITTCIETLAASDVPLVGVILGASPAPELKLLGKVTEAEMLSQWQVNVLGPQQLLSGLIRQCLRKQKRGTVIAILTSAMGSEGKASMSSMGAYVIAKYGLEGLLAVAAADYSWLTTAAVRPGFTETPMLDAFDERFLDQLRARAPFQTADDIALEVMSHVPDAE